jgi:hypothetical protein
MIKNAVRSLALSRAGFSLCLRVCVAHCVACVIIVGVTSCRVVRREGVGVPVARRWEVGRGGQGLEVHLMAVGQDVGRAAPRWSEQIFVDNSSHACRTCVADDARVGQIDRNLAGHLLSPPPPPQSQSGFVCRGVCRVMLYLLDMCKFYNISEHVVTTRDTHYTQHAWHRWRWWAHREEEVGEDRRATDASLLSPFAGAVGDSRSAKRSRPQVPVLTRHDTTRNTTRPHDTT